MTASGQSSPGFPAAARSGAAAIIDGTQKLSAALASSGKPPVSAAIPLWNKAHEGLAGLLSAAS